MAGFIIDPQVTKCINWINRNCARCEHGYMQENVPYCKAAEKITSHARCVGQYEQEMPKPYCSNHQRIDDWNPLR